MNCEEFKWLIIDLSHESFQMKEWNEIHFASDIAIGLEISQEMNNRPIISGIKPTRQLNVSQVILCIEMMLF